MSELWLEPDAALDGADALAAAGQGFASLRSGSGAELAAASAARPWGSDDIGQTFERNYRPIEQQVLTAWEQLAVYLQDLGAAAAASVQDNLQADEHASVRVKHSYRKRS
jgi:hypothetical protein